MGNYSRGKKDEETNIYNFDSSGFDDWNCCPVSFLKSEAIATEIHEGSRFA